MISTKNLVSSIALLSPLFMATNSVSFAAPEADEVASGTTIFEEITVTATRRAVTLNKVPVSLSAFTQESMDDQGIKDIDSIARITPGVNFNRQDRFGVGNRSSISIRGITSGVGAATTGIYLDETPIQTRSAGNAASNTYPLLFDLERVEILRGPQGTLFGAGSEGGTIRFLTPAPSLDELSVYGRGEVAATENGDPSFEAGVAVGAPIVQDKVGFRVSAYYKHSGGWVDRVDRHSGLVLDDNQNDGNDVSLRGTLLIKPSDVLTITPSIFYQNLKSGGGSAYWEELSDPQNGVFLTGDALSGNASDKLALYALKVEYDFDGMDLISSTSYLKRDATTFSDYTQFLRSVTIRQNYPVIPGEYAIGHFGIDQTAFTQEIRLQSNDEESALHWLVGAFYTKSDQTGSQITETPFFAQMVLEELGADYLSIFGAPLGDMQSAYTEIQETTDEQIAVFAQVDYDFSEKLKATVGLRYSDVKFNFNSTNQGPFAGWGTNEGAKHEKPFTPKFGLSYQATDDHLFYASASKGFRSGGAQRQPSSICADDLAALGIDEIPDGYDADSVWSYEVGAKNRLFDGKVQLNTSAFYIDWTNIQQSLQLPTCRSSLILNVGKAVSKGFDVALTAQLTDALRLETTIAYTNAEYTASIITENLNNGATTNVVLDGDALSNIAPWVVTVSGQYDFDISDTASFVRVDYDYRGAAPEPLIGRAGIDPLAHRRPATHFVSARAGIELNSLKVSVFVDNLFNSTPVLTRTRHSARDTITLFYSSTMKPRTFGVSASFKY